MFDELAAKQQGGSSGSSTSASHGASSSSSSGGVNVEALQGVRFGHVHAGAVPRGEGVVPSDDSVPYVGVLACVKSAVRRPDGTLLLEYEGQRRIKLLSVWQAEPYMVAAACHLTDSGEGSDEDVVDLLEWELYGQLQEVGRLSQLLATDDSAPLQLPDSVPRYAPPSRPTAGRGPRTLAEHLTAAGHPAGAQISMWQRFGSVYGGGRAAREPADDPYSVLSERLGKDTRQELFSFAAAGMLELGPAERLALLTSTDRAARLQWVAAAVAPFLEEQRARASVARALRGAGAGAVTGGEGPAVA
ncbi:hypothetical protein HYH02_002615 [Chlamydomonas schloesseri]|uniref:Lon N-terminal domain-containing protein n=1 Tax=Chlamydomonas schloesseri TaxID=2026947 RepID=A0A835WQR9_9CHLO|nr:hypothetical protein HYH02_002615 [Chlamydomonas schloesseri]|eukprot:KAG2452369.1 hypothetical protein HYH02_002615 [Chlamydomonas schloesseri]